MHVPAHIRFTLAELTAFGLQSAEVLARANSAIHLVLREHQTTLPTPEMQAACSIISVEDADGITVAVLKHPEGKAWDRRPLSAVVATPDGIEIRDLRAEPEPVVPSREPPHAAPEGVDRFQRGVSAMYGMLKRAMEIGRLRSFGAQFDNQRPNHDIVWVDGEFSLRELAKAFLDAYQPQITISDQVRFKLAKEAMMRVLLKARRADGIHFLGEFCASDDDDQVSTWPDLLTVEGTIDIDALAKAAWSVRKGEG